MTLIHSFSLQKGCSFVILRKQERMDAVSTVVILFKIGVKSHPLILNQIQSPTGVLHILKQSLKKKRMQQEENKRKEENWKQRTSKKGEQVNFMLVE